jgi:hypothetical protein
MILADRIPRAEIGFANVWLALGDLKRRSATSRFSLLSRRPASA